MHAYRAQSSRAAKWLTWMSIVSPTACDTQPHWTSCCSGCCAGPFTISPTQCHPCTGLDINAVHSNTILQMQHVQQTSCQELKGAPDIHWGLIRTWDCRTKP